MTTQPQMRAFFPLYAAARAEVERRTGLTGEDARHAWIKECTGGRTSSLRLVRSGNEYARLMLETAQAAEDYPTAAHYQADITARHRYMISALLRQLSEITGTPHTWEYARGILSQMRLPPHLEDLPESLHKPLIYALDTHRRRLLRRAGWSSRLAFDPSISYPPHTLTTDQP